MDDVKFNPKNIVSHKNYPGEREIHIKSGFRISYSQKSASYGPLIELKPRSFEYYSLCHLIKGNGWYWSPGEGKKYFNAGDGVLISPGFIHSYGGYESNYVEDYVCFNGPIADYLFRSGVLKNGIIKIGNIRRLLPVINASLDLSDSGQINANALLQSLLYELFRENENPTYNSTSDNIGKLLNEFNSSISHWWTVSEMASYCNLSESYFRRLFKKKTGVGPKHYYDCLKIKFASEKLLRSDDKLDVIASQLGYVNRFHFSKVFKRINGVSPDNYRKGDINL